MTQKNDDSIEQLAQGLFRSKEGAKAFLEVLMNQAMQAEITTHLDAEPHERSPQRRGYRNGTKPRTLKTRVGELDLTVPQARDCEPYHPSMFNRWQRCERALLVACAEMYFQGVSTRKVQEVLDMMCGLRISSMTVSRVAAEVDEKLSAFLERRLDAMAYRYVFVDARYEKVRSAGRIISQAVLVVAGVNSEGFREVLDWRVADSESEDSWGQLFMDLKARGLQGVELVISDAHSGIRSAIQRHFQGAAWQRCRVHFKREAWKKVGSKYFREIRRDLSLVFLPEERKECLQRGEEMAVKWEGRYPRLAKMLRDGMEDCLSILDFPPSHQRRLASTNVLERVMKELRKRTRVVCVFPNRSSCARLVGANLIEIHEKWITAVRPVFSWDNVTHLGGEPKVATAELARFLPRPSAINKEY